MANFFKNRRASRKRRIAQAVERLNVAPERQSISPSLEENTAVLKALFAHMDFFRCKLIESDTARPARYLIAYLDGMVDAEILNNSVIRPLMLAGPIEGERAAEELAAGVVQVGEIQEIDSFQAVIESITYGSTVLIAEGCSRALLLNTKSFSLRAIGEPDNEKSLVGPREGFTESLVSNLSQLLRRLRTHELKARTMVLGTRTKTTVCVCYLESLARADLLDELLRRLGQINIDGVLDSNYINELICDHPRNAFRTTGYTERPDVIAGKLLEGRMAIFVDGSPIVLTVPYLFIENFQSSEDYFLNFYYTSTARLLRIIAFLLTVIVPGLYVAAVAFHQEMLPLQLLIRVTIERQSVPLPAAVEAVIMLIVFDILRETGIRMPSNIGQALSIVGALVIGQAAVEASLVAAPMIIVVAATGITSLLVPRLNAPILIWRGVMLLLSSAFGFFGLTIGLALMLISINNLTSLGVEQIHVKGSFTFEDNKDIFFRAPWRDMLQRPDGLSRDSVRQGDGGPHA